MTDQFKDLADRLDNPPLSWCPKGVPDGLDAERCIVSNEIYGTIESIEDRQSDFGPYRMIVVIDGTDRRVQIAGLGTVLVKRFSALQIGQRIGVRYLGEHASSTQGFEAYDDYTVAVG